MLDGCRRPSNFIKTSFNAKILEGKFFIPIFFFYSFYGHLLNRICNIADLLEQNFSQGGTSQFAEVFFKIKNTISHLIFVISTNFFMFLLLLMCSIEHIIKKLQKWRQTCRHYCDATNLTFTDSSYAKIISTLSSPHLPSLV